MKLNLQTVSHKSQRYRTCGDYFYRKNIWYFRISRFRNKSYFWLVLFHEFLEWGLCQLHGIKTRDIDQFDMTYEKAREACQDSEIHRAPCGCKFQAEPGDDIHSPYHDEHSIASQCERLIAKALDIDWISYEDAIEKL